MNLQVQSSGAGPELVLLHGWAMHSGVFDALTLSLAQQQRVQRIDLPGHGRSALQADETNLEQWVTALLPHIPPRAVVLGWSLGGLLALKIAQQMQLRALILISTTPCFVANDSWPHGMQPEVFAQFFSHLQQNLNSTVIDFLRLQVRGDRQAAETFAALKNSLLQHPADALALQCGLEILRDADERHALPDIDVPTLVIAGEYDRITLPAANQYLAAQLPSARYQLIKRAGHAPFLSHREAVLAELNEFLSTVSQPVLAHD